MKNKDWFNTKNAQISYTERSSEDFDLVVKINNRTFSLETDIFIDYEPQVSISLKQEDIHLLSFFQTMPSTTFANLPTQIIQDIFQKWIVENATLDYFIQQSYIYQEEYLTPYIEGGKEQVAIYKRLRFEKRLQEDHKKRTHLPEIYEALRKTNLLNVFQYCTSLASFVLELTDDKTYSADYYKFYYHDLEKKYIAYRELEKPVYHYFETLAGLIDFLEDNHMEFINSFQCNR